MIISNIIGGLGNQMFQYAAGKALSLKLSIPLKLYSNDFANYTWHSYELESVFSLNASNASESDLSCVLGWQAIPFFKRILAVRALRLLRKRTFVVEPTFYYWDGFETLKGDLYLQGSWQSAKYFENFSSDIRKEFVFKKPLSERNQILSKRILESNSVSVHIRRGNYVSDSCASLVHGMCDVEYYKSAVEFISSRAKNPVFFIFSDDPGWVEQNLSLKLPFVIINHNTGSESFNDMRLMSLCKNNIIANSTFSWWGGWLNQNEQKIIIAPKRWFLKESMQQDSQDICPKNWIRI